MKAGELNKIVQIYTPRQVVDEYGTQKTTYVLVLDNIRAKLIDGNMYRQLTDNAIYNAQSHYFVIRDCYMTKINVGNLVFYGSRYYRVETLKHLNDERAVELTTELFDDEVEHDFDPVHPDRNSAVRHILSIMPDSIKNSLSGWYCPFYQGMTNEYIKRELAIVADLSGNDRHLTTFHFDGTRESGIDEKGHIHFDGDDDFASLGLQINQDVEGFGEPYERGITWVLDRTYDQRPADYTASQYVFVIPVLSTTFGSVNYTTTFSNGCYEYKAYNSNNLYRKFVQFTTGNDAPDISYLSVEPNDELGDNTNHAVFATSQGKRASQTLKINDANKVGRFRGLTIGCAKASYNSTTKIWTLTTPFKGTFRQMIIFNRALNEDEIAWIKNNMFHYAR